MDDPRRKLEYWNKRIVDSYKRANRDVLKNLDEVTEFAGNLDEKSKKRVQDRQKAVMQAMRELAMEVDKIITEKGKKLIN